MNPVEMLARVYPWPVDPDEGFRRAVTFLESRWTAETLQRAANGVALVGFLFTAIVSLLLPPGVRLPATLALLALAALAGALGRTGPELLATARRVRALGDAPDLVARAVLRMRLSPSPERAAEFAAAAGEGPLAASLASHVRRAQAGRANAFDTFGEEWTEWFPSLSRSLTLVVAASAMEERDRNDTLDRALTVVLDGTREQMQSFAASVSRPVTALYAFGVLLPTALVALLPAAAAVGVGVTSATVAVLYGVLLPLGLLGASVWLLARRPVAFPPPNVSRTHPDVPDRRVLAAGCSFTVAVVGWLVTDVMFPSWAPVVAALGFGAGTALVVFHRPVLAVYENVRAVEAGLTDGLAFVGRRVASGRAVESAIAEAGSELTGEIATVFRETARTQRQLQVGIHEAFLGDHGSLADVPSRRVRGAVAFLSLAAAEGKPAGPAVLALADHINELRRVEESARHELRSVCGILQSTGAIFGPLVAGSTVALADGMVVESAAVPGGASSLPWLGLIVGWYVLALAAILPALSTALVRGFDRSLVSVRVGRSLVTATVVYLLAYRLVGGLA